MNGTRMKGFRIQVRFRYERGEIESQKTSATFLPSSYLSNRNLRYSIRVYIPFPLCSSSHRVPLDKPGSTDMCVTRLSESEDNYRKLTLSQMFIV